MIVPFKKIAIGKSFIDDDEIDRARDGYRGPLPVWTKESANAAHNNRGSTHHFEDSILVLEVS